MMRTILKLFCVWFVSVLLAFFSRHFLPQSKGLALTHGGIGHFVPYNRLAFWTCVLVAGVTTFFFLAKAMVRDLGFR